MRLFDTVPDSWDIIKITDIADINPTRPDDLPDDHELASFVPMKKIEELTGRLDPSEYKEWGEIKSGYTRFQEGDVIFAKITPSMENGKAALAQNLKNGVAAGTTELHIIRPSESVLSKYLLYFVLQEGFRREAEANMTGTAGHMRVPSEFIESVEIPLPPLFEQERIVAKIEELFSKLDSGVSEVEESKERLKFYNRAVLKAAMEGKLTKRSRQSISKTGRNHLENILEYRREKWDDEFQEVFKYSGKEYDEPESADPLEHAKTPEEWTWGTINQISYVVGGLTKNKSKREDYSTEVPYLRVANVYANELDLDKIKTIKISEREEMTKMLKDGDLLVVEGNGSKSQIGRVALWDGSISPCSHQNHLIKVRILKEALRKFALYWLLSPLGRDAIVDVASSTSGLHTLSISKVRSIPIPIPPKEEAEKVVQEIERRTTVTDQALKNVGNELNRIGRLRQSILKQAFEGNLVPQDPKEDLPIPNGGDTKVKTGEQVTLSEVTNNVE